MNSPHAAPVARSGFIAFLCFLVAVIEGFDLQVIGIAGPSIAKELALRPQDSGTAFAASLAGLAIGALVGGRLADRFGRRKTLVASVALFGVFTAATALSENLAMLIILRLITGLGLGGSMPNIIAIVSDVVSARRKTMAVAAMSCGLAIGGMLVAQLAHFLSGIGWRGLFVIGGVLPLLLVPFLWRGLSGISTTSPADRATASTAGLGAIFTDSMIMRTFSLWTVFSLTLLQLSLLLNWLPTLVLARGLQKEHAIAAATMLNLGSVFGAIAIGWLCDRYGALKPMLAVYVVMALALFALSQAGDVQSILPASFVAGATVLGAQFALYGLSPRIYPIEIRAYGVGAAVAVGRIGAISGPLIAGLLLGRGVSGDQLLLLMVPLVLLAGAAMWVLGRSAGATLEQSRDAA